jgi:hypothetical protein
MNNRLWHIVLGIIATALAAVFVRQLPDMRRYLKMRAM